MYVELGRGSCCGGVIVVLIQLGLVVVWVQH